MLVIVAGGGLFWYFNLYDRPETIEPATVLPTPTLVPSPTPLPEDVDQDTLDLLQMSDSDELEDIEADLNATDLSTLDKELDGIENEL